jgi:hypothetical protein
MENRAPYSIRGGYGANAPAGRGGGDGAGYSVVFSQELRHARTGEAATFSLCSGGNLGPIFP